MDSWLVFRRDRVILNQWTKRNDWSFKRFSKTSFAWSLPIRQEILNVSQIGITFHGFCPPFFIQTWLQQYCRRTIEWLSPAPRLHIGDCSRFTTFTENLVICCNQITKIFCTRYGSAIASSARSPFDFGPVADLAISVFREVSINTVFTQIHTSRRL